MMEKEKKKKQYMNKIEIFMFGFYKLIKVSGTYKIDIAIGM